MSAAPRVSVVMAVYRDSPYVAAAIKSLLAQTFTDFELVLVDDCGGDGSMEAALEALVGWPGEVSVVWNETNLGLASSLNAGFSRARGELIARMDADDLCHPERLARQVAFLDANPDYAAVSARLVTFGEVGGGPGRRWWPLETRASDIRTANLLSSVVPHGAILLRAAWLRQHSIHYPEGARGGVECAVWADIHRLGGQIAVLPEVLYLYRQHGECISKRDATAQRGTAAAVRLALLEEAGLALSAEDARFLAGPKVGLPLRAEDLSGLQDLVSRLVDLPVASSVSWRRTIASYVYGILAGDGGKLQRMVALGRVKPWLPVCLALAKLRGAMDFRARTSAQRLLRQQGLR